MAGVAAAATVIALIAVPWKDVLRGPVAAYASRQLQRAVTLDGIGVEFGSVTRLQFDGVTIANAAWSAEPTMARADRIVLFYSLGSLLTGDPDYVQLVSPELLLERNADGAGNWQIEGDAKTWPLLSAIDVDRGSVRYRDPALRADIEIAVKTSAVEGQPSTVEFTGKGKFRGEAVKIDGRSGGLVSLRRTGDPYPLTINVRAGPNEVAFDGTVVPGDPENLRGALRLRGRDLSELYPIVPSPLPWTPPYSLKGELAHTKALWTFRKFSGTVGDSDLAGEFRVDVSTRRPRTTADLSSSKFDYKDLGGFIGLPPQNPRTPVQQDEAARRAKSDRVLPERAFDLGSLRELDADVKFRGKSVRFGETPIDNLTSHIKLQNGVMQFDPLDFGIGEGHVVSNVRLDLNRSTPTADGQIELRRVQLARLVPKLASQGGATGNVGGRARFKAAGNSIAAMASTLEGDGVVLMRGGEASTLQLWLTNLDLANAAALLSRPDDTSPITCAVLAFHAREGIAKPELFVIDTPAVVINGEGTIDLRQEKLDLTLTAKSKQMSLVALRGPIVVEGSFAHPIARPSLMQAGARIGASIGLGAIAGPLALLPLIDLGGGEDVDCRAVIAKALENTDTKERIARDKRATAPKSARRPNATAAAAATAD